MDHRVGTADYSIYASDWFSAVKDEQYSLHTQFNNKVSKL